MAATAQEASRHERADMADRAAGLAWRRGNLAAARQLIAAARELDPARADLWTRREAVIAGSEETPPAPRRRPSRAPGRAPSAPREPQPGACADCGTAVPGHGRAICQACGLLRKLAEGEREAGQ
jgi:hypothetical protein